MKRVDGKLCISRYKEFKICKNLRFLFVFGILNLFLIGFVSATDIYNCAQLQSMALTGNHRLMNDINCNAVNFNSIGDNNNQFTANLDGRGYKIYGLHIDENISNYVGLIGYLSPGYTIENVVLVFNMTQ